MVDRLVAVDDTNYRLPAPVLSTLGSDIADSGTELGGAVGDAISSALTEPGPVKDELDATFAHVPTGSNGTAPHVQMGPTTRTENRDNTLIIRNNQAGQPATRVAVVPTGKITTGVGGVFKVFGDTWTDDGPYRDAGFYFHANQNNSDSFLDTGTNGTGAFWLNGKVGPFGDPVYAGKNPDIGFSFQDGGSVAGRFALLAPRRTLFIAGAGKPDVGGSPSQVAMRLEVQGDMGFSGLNRDIRWQSTASTFDANGNVATQGVAPNLMRFGSTSLAVYLGGAKNFEVRTDGSWIMGSGSRLAASATAGFFHIRTISGTPTGAPSTTGGGSTAMVYDDNSNTLWVYDAITSVWKSVTLT